MRWTSAAIGSAAFFVVAPGTVAGLVPYWITDWRVTPPVGDIWAIRFINGVLIVAGITSSIVSHALPVTVLARRRRSCRRAIS